MLHVYNFSKIIRKHHPPTHLLIFTSTNSEPLSPRTISYEKLFLTLQEAYYLPNMIVMACVNFLPHTTIQNLILNLSQIGLPILAASSVWVDTTHFSSLTWCLATQNEVYAPTTWASCRSLSEPESQPLPQTSWIRFCFITISTDDL